MDARESLARSADRLATNSQSVVFVSQFVVLQLEFSDPLQESFSTHCLKLILLKLILSFPLLDWGFVISSLVECRHLITNSDRQGGLDLYHLRFWPLTALEANHIIASHLLQMMRRQERGL